MSEKADFRILKKNLPQGHDRLDRIENIAGNGTPDLNYCIEGVEGWIEMKSPTEPVYPHSKLFSGNHKLSQSQKNWLLRQRNAGGNGFVLIATNKRWILIDGEHADNVNDLTVAQLLKIACWRGNRPVSKSIWRDLWRILSV